MRIERCPDVCGRAYWQRDDALQNVGKGGQWNCPSRLGGDSAAAVIDGRVRCEHFKRKEDNDE